MLSDLRFAFRQFRRSSAFVGLVVSSLAFGIGGNIALFSVVHSALYRPLPYHEPQRLVQLWSAHRDGRAFEGVPGPSFVAWREHSRSLERAAIVSPIAYNLTDGGSAERVDGLGVSASYLEVLGLAPELGRGFAPDEDQVGHDNRVLLITHEWWQSRFGGAPDIVGRKLWLQRVPYEVIGVLSPGALFQEPVSFLVPLVLEDAPWKMSLDTRGPESSAESDRA